MIKMSQTIDIILQPIYAIKKCNKRRNKMCKDNNNDIYDDDNNTSNNKSQFDLRKILVL